MAGLGDMGRLTKGTVVVCLCASGNVQCVVVDGREERYEQQRRPDARYI